MNLHRLTGGRFIPASVLFFVLLIVYSWDNTFPFQYHNDEPSKVWQIVSKTRNLRHPPLMLEATALVWKVLPWEQSETNAVLAGRLLSACAVAAACTLLGVSLARTTGNPVAMLGGLLAGMHPAVFESAHYLKEDSWFLLGIAVFLFSLCAAERVPAPRRFFLLGIAAGFAASTKFLGWTLLPCAILLAFATNAPKGPSFRALAMGTVLSAALLYLPAFFGANILSESMAEEVRWMLHGDYGTGHAVPHSGYIYLLGVDFPFPLLAAGLCAAILLIAGGLPLLQTPLSWRLSVFWAAAMLIGLSFLPKFSDRYLLPVLFLLPAAATLGVHVCIRKFATDRHGFLFATALCAFVLMSIPSTMERWSGFAMDSRAELAEWITENLPPDILLAQDAMVNLAGANPRLADRVVPSSMFAADLGTIEQLRAQGITHVAGSWDVHHRYVEERLRPSGPDDGSYRRRAEFYRKLHKDTPLLWSGKSRNPKPLHPGLFLFEL